MEIPADELTPLSGKGRDIKEANHSPSLMQKVLLPFVTITLMAFPSLMQKVLLPFVTIALMALIYSNVTSTSSSVSALVSTPTEYTSVYEWGCIDCEQCGKCPAANCVPANRQWTAAYGGSHGKAVNYAVPYWRPPKKNPSKEESMISMKLLV